jgi:hypothetical protein
MNLAAARPGGAAGGEGAPVADLTNRIVEVANEPKSMTVGGETVQQHSLPDLIKAQEALNAAGGGTSGGASKRGRGIRFDKLIPPGTV